MKKTCILHVAQAAGGVDRYLRSFLKYINHDKFDNIVVFSQDYDIKNYSNLVIAYEKLNMSREININDLMGAIKLRKIIKKYNPDIIYAHSSKAGAISRIANIGLKNKCIYNPHGWAFNMRCTKRKKELYTLIEKILAFFCDKIVCISEHEKETALKKRICKENKIKVISNGIDIDSYLEEFSIKKKLKIPENVIVVGMVGRISKQKAPDVFIRVAKKIKERIPNSYYVIVGCGEEEKEVLEYAKRNNMMDSLLITGWVDRPLDYIKLFDIALLLSRWEGFGLVLPEYMIAKKPIVASRVGAIPEIIQNLENGILVDPDDVEATYQAVIKLIEDEELRKKISNSAYRVAYEKYNVKRVAKEHEELFREILLKI